MSVRNISYFTAILIFWSICILTCSAVEEDCENAIFTDDMIPTTNSTLTCLGIGKSFRRTNGNLAAYDCCSKRKQNLHCRFVCHLRAMKWLRADGTFDSRKIMKQSLRDYGYDLGVSIAIEARECISKYGTYKPSNNCHDIERLLACFEDIAHKECKTATSLFMNTNSLDDGIMKCRGRINHWPTLKLDHNKECLAITNSTYMQYRCLWMNTGILNNDYSMCLNGTSNWTKVVFGITKGNELMDAFKKHLSRFDLPTLWGQANADNVNDLLWEVMAATKEAYYEVCGEITNSFINTID